LTVELTYLARGQFHSFAREISGNAPLYFERSILLDQPVEKRTTPFEIQIPLTLEGATDIRGPSLFIATPPPRPASMLDNQFVTEQLSSSADAAGCHLRYHLYEPAGRFPPEQYLSHNQAMQQAVDMLAARIVFAQITK